MAASLALREHYMVKGQEKEHLSAVETADLPRKRRPPVPRGGGG